MMETSQNLIRYEFWNGQTSNKKKYQAHDGLVTMKHNPCLWTNVGVICKDCTASVTASNEKNGKERRECTSCKPWKGVHVSASQVLDRWEKFELTDTDFLHHLRYVAYGIGKRNFDNEEVVWPGNLSTLHRPKLCVEKENGSKYTIRFAIEESEQMDPTFGWKATVEEGASFYWSL